MISVDNISSGESYRFVLSPNCSISWRELLLFYCLTCVVALAVGLFFTLQGLWLVLPFSGLEMLALGIGLYVTSRQVYRREVITLDPECTRIEKVYNEPTRSGNSKLRGCVLSTSVGVVEVSGASWLLACQGKASKWAVFLPIGKRML
jgi:uncharacterized membrane protein